MCSRSDDPSMTDQSAVDPLRALAEADWSGRPEVRSVATDDGLVYVIGPLRPAVPALDVELGAPFWCYQHDRFCQYPIGPHRPAGAALTASATDEPLDPRDVAFIVNCIPWEREDLRQRVRAALAASATDERRCSECGVPFAEHPDTDACAIAQEARLAASATEGPTRLDVARD